MDPFPLGVRSSFRTLRASDENLEQAIGEAVEEASNVVTELTTDQKDMLKRLTFALFPSKIRDRHRGSTIYTEHIRQNPLSRLFGNRAPQHRRLRRELSSAHARDNTPSPAHRPATTFPAA
jgi:hypothetical protein